MSLVALQSLLEAYTSRSIFDTQTSMELHLLNFSCNEYIQKIIWRMFFRF